MAKETFLEVGQGVYASPAVVREIASAKRSVKKSGRTKTETRPKKPKPINVRIAPGTDGLKRLSNALYAGGFIKPGKPTAPGERGPELFVPNKKHRLMSWPHEAS